MTEHIDPVGAATQIKETYRRYLRSLLAVRDPQIDAALTTAIDSTPLLDKGPYLEATPPYAPGASLQQLIDEGVLTPGFADLAGPALPLERPLYVHQEMSVRKAAAGRNVVVATGTGSGKTESFLLPILDSLVREHEAGSLGSGVRALLLYPMNALANDQMKRLRQLLTDYPHITFGRYTGDTENDPRKARESFADLNIGEPILPNERLSREEMRAEPPHILLTNYAMLEYLLLRPQDFELFGEDASTWRFLVVDEAHVYDGTQGAEIAMLLRRVRDRVAPDKPIRCIATSATVGGDTDPGAVTRFASNLFGQPFEWREDDRSRQDLIMARRVEAPPGPYWGPLSAEQYAWAASSPDPGKQILAAAADAGFDAGEDAANALLHEKTLVELRTTLAEGPQPFETVAARVFGSDPERQSGLAGLVELASSLRGSDGTTPLSARYHLFLRATEGAFTCLSEEGPHVHLARHDVCPHCVSPVFEIGSCKRCGSVHLAGHLVNEGGVTMLRPRKAGQRPTWLVLTGGESAVDEDEEAVTDDPLQVDGDLAQLCTSCGAVSPADASSCRAAGCGSSAVRQVRKLKQRGDEIAGCLVCGARGSGTVRGFETGPDASGAVITTSLYQSLPTGDGPVGSQDRKLLMFSDSRQAAAFFAPYLEDSYGRVQRRRLITQGLLAARADQEPVGVSDAVFEIRRSASDVRHFRRRSTAQEQMREIAPWVMAEILSTDDRQSLEGLGLVGIELDRDPAWQAPAPLRALGLDEEEVWAFLQELMRTLRQQGAVTMPDEVPANDEIFQPRLGPIYARSTGPEPVRRVLSWLPGRGTNRRIDYVRRVLRTLDAETDAAAILEGVWNYLTSPQTPVDWLRGTTERGLGAVHQVDHELIRMRYVDESSPVFKCSVCRRTSPVSVRGVCPALGCEGTLEAFVPPPVSVESDHYRSLYRSMSPVPLKAMEHTAQWTNREAASIQQKFIRGEVNALSCSTTFELGVDVGELQAVMLRNMPPTTANYLQRAGRAGRRSGAAALVVTYAQRRSHDLTRFAAPEVMMSGAVRAPFVPLTNERIDRRHAHSVALSAFFRWYFDQTSRIARSAGEFFLPSDMGAGRSRQPGRDLPRPRANRHPRVAAPDPAEVGRRADRRRGRRLGRRARRPAGTGPRRAHQRRADFGRSLRRSGCRPQLPASRSLQAGGRHAASA